MFLEYIPWPSGNLIKEKFIKKEVLDSIYGIRISRERLRNPGGGICTFSKFPGDFDVH